MHTWHRGLLGQINWLQSRTLFQCWYKFSRCASNTASPTICNGQVLNTSWRDNSCRSQWKLQFWPLTRPMRTIGFPDASYRNDEDRSLVDYESQKINRSVLSRTVAELYSFMACFGSCQLLRGLWIDLSGEVADIHMRTDAKNLVTTARTIHLPEQRNNPHDFHVTKRSLFKKYS